MLEGIIVWSDLILTNFGEKNIISIFKEELKKKINGFFISNQVGIYVCIYF